MNYLEMHGMRIRILQPPHGFRNYHPHFFNGEIGPRRSVVNLGPIIAVTGFYHCLTAPAMDKKLKERADKREKVFEPTEIFFRCKAHLNDANMVIALLNGSRVGGGIPWEIG